MVASAPRVSRRLCLASPRPNSQPATNTEAQTQSPPPDGSPPKAAAPPTPTTLRPQGSDEHDLRLNRVALLVCQVI